MTIYPSYIAINATVCPRIYNAAVKGAVQQYAMHFNTCCWYCTHVLHFIENLSKTVDTVHSILGDTDQPISKPTLIPTKLYISASNFVYRGVKLTGKNSQGKVRCYLWSSVYSLFSKEKIFWDGLRISLAVLHPFRTHWRCIFINKLEISQNNESIWPLYES